MAGAGEDHDELADRDVLLYRNDIGTRHHDTLDPALAQTENVFQHGGFGGREARFRLLGGQDEFKVGAGCRRLPAKQNAHDAREPALVQLAMLRHQHGQTVMLGLVGFAAGRGLAHDQYM